MAITDNQIKVQQALVNSPSLECTCGSVLFRQVVAIKEVSKLLIGAPDNVIVPIPLYRCDDCGAVLESLLPKGLNIFNEEVEETKPTNRPTEGKIILDNN